MKVTERQTTTITISEVRGLDPVDATFEQTGPAAGRVTIRCYTEAWTAYWGSMGEGTSVAEFFEGAPTDYIAGKLDSRPQTVFDRDGLIESAKKEIIQRRRKWFASKDEARRDWDELADAHIPERGEDLWNSGAIMEKLLGPEWFLCLPMKASPEYQYLTRIVEAVKAGLKYRRIQP